MIRTLLKEVKEYISSIKSVITNNNAKINPKTVYTDTAIKI